MSHYARNIAQDLLDAVRAQKQQDSLVLRTTLFETLDQISPTDFAPIAQAKYAETLQRMRLHVKNMTNRDSRMDPDLLVTLINLFDEHYGYSGASGRSFGFMSNPSLRQIVERDYRELQSTLIAAQAWKSAIIMAGSVLEAVLFDQLTKDSATVALAMAAAAAPKKKGDVRDITLDTYEDEWRLNDMIKVAAELKIVRPEDERTIHTVLREYRNFVHPRAEIKGANAVTDAEATASKGMLDIVLNYLSR